MFYNLFSRSNEKGQLVLYNQDNQSVTVQHYLPDYHFDPNIPIQVKYTETECL
jgi:hypothetical protein